MSLTPNPIASTSSSVVSTDQPDPQKYSKFCQCKPDLFSDPSKEYPLPPRGALGSIWSEEKFEWTLPKSAIVRTKYVWLTVNPSPEWWARDKFMLVVKRMESMCKNKPFEASIYVFEQESLDDKFEHPHVHCLISRRGPHSGLETMIRNNMGRFCGNEKHVVIRSNISLEQCKVKMAYMSGHKKGNNKKGVCKAEIVSNDARWRLQWGLKPMYGEISL